MACSVEQGRKHRLPARPPTSLPPCPAAWLAAPCKLRAAAPLSGRSGVWSFSCFFTPSRGSLLGKKESSEEKSLYLEKSFGTHELFFLFFFFFFGKLFSRGYYCILLRLQVWGKFEFKPLQNKRGNVFGGYFIKMCLRHFS